MTIWTDEQLKQETLAKEAKIQQAGQFLKDNNPSNVNSIPALRDRVKKLEILLGIYEWMD